MKVKSDSHAVIRACFLALLILAGPCVAKEKSSVQISVGALTLAPGSDGMVHWRVGNTETTPLQLSTRYFSERLKMPVGVVGFYDQPVAKGAEDPPEPFLSLQLPATSGLAFLVIWSSTDKNGKASWQGNVISGSEWKDSSMRLFNSTSESLGLLCGEQAIQIGKGKSLDFHAKDWPKAFPVKIFRLQPEKKAIFSSKWRVTQGRRELCFITAQDSAVSFKSLIDLALPPEEAAE